jgi:hypothetical protein
VDGVLCIDDNENETQSKEMKLPNRPIHSSETKELRENIAQNPNNISDLLQSMKKDLSRPLQPVPKKKK